MCVVSEMRARGREGGRCAILFDFFFYWCAVHGDVVVLLRHHHAPRLRALHTWHNGVGRQTGRHTGGAERVTTMGG